MRLSNMNFLNAIFIVLMLFSVQPVDARNGYPDLATAIRDIAEKNIPAVVHIQVNQRQEVAVPYLPFQNDPFFRYFFEMPRAPKKFKEEITGIGTGIIMNAKGFIITNNHVVAGATKIQVLLSNGQSYPGKIVGTDPKTDLAVIKIDVAEALPFVSFGDSDKIEVGEWVVAIGHPRGLSHTVTQGIISAKHRRGIMDPSSYQDFLQTDAAINPGNSGGPLLNLRGEVIGVNAAIASESGGFEGIGFAIPVNMVNHVAEAIIRDGKVLRGWLGISIQNIGSEIAKSFGLNTGKGVVIANVVKGGPADTAGLKRGDIVIAFDGNPVPDAGAFQNEVARTQIGKDVMITVLRDGRDEKFPVKVGSSESLTKIISESLKDRIGALIRRITTQEAEKFGLDLHEGVAIDWLDPKGPFGIAGFERGDIILEVQGTPLDGVEHFIEIIGSLPPNEKIVLLALDHRTGQTGYVQVIVQ